MEENAKELKEKLFNKKELGWNFSIISRKRALAGNLFCLSFIQICNKISRVDSEVESARLELPQEQQAENPLTALLQNDCEHPPAEPWGGWF